MRMFVLGSAALAALIAVGSAQAADLPPAPAPVYKAPAMVPPAFSWTGFYIGIEGGWGWGRENFTDNTAIGIPPGDAVNHSPDGGIFGGVVGGRYQVGQFVFGVEGTGAWADIHDTVTLAPGATNSLKVKSLYTATGQIGWAVAPQWLIYAKGGWAGAKVDTNFANANAVASNSQNDSGWTAGGGIDYAVWQNLVLGLEYDHYDLSYGASSNAASNGGAPFIVANPSRLTIEQVVGRLTWKFP
jgi:outer membrane immunogenic protein